MWTAARERCGHKRPKQAQIQVGVPSERVPGGSASENNSLSTNESSRYWKGYFSLVSCNTFACEIPGIVI